MNPVKRFLLIYFIVYIIVGITIIVAFGPAGYSKEYMAEFKADHDHYIEVIKSDEFKLWKENDRLNEKPQGADFVATYESNPKFVQEQSRRMYFDYFFDFFNFGMVVYLMVHFARKPLCKLLDEQIAALKEKLDRAAKARAEAVKRKNEAQNAYDSLDEELAKLDKEKMDNIDQDNVRIETLASETLAQIDSETEDRKQEEEQKAAMLLKKELITSAIDMIAEKAKAEPLPEDNAELIGQFIAELEKRK